MLTVSFQSVLEGVLKRAGIAPADAGEDDIAALIDSLADRTETAVEYYKWPVYVPPTEQRFFRPVWSAAETYDDGDEVYFEDDDTYYTANQSTVAGESPESAPTKWDELEDFRKYVLYEQPGETPIAATLRAWDRDPLSDPSAIELKYSVRNDGIYFSPDVDVTNVWLDFRERAPDFHATTYDAAETYAADDIVYFPEYDGNVYVANQATTAGQTPENAATKWDLVPFPAFLAKAVKAGGLADWFTSDEKPGSAAIWEGKFTDLLDEQVWQLTKLQGQTGQPQVSPQR